MKTHLNNDPNIFKDKTQLITGGTGSFGNAVLHRFLGVRWAEETPVQPFPVLET
jgi:FlaA1/EpsC-like NDP-sugar epimerase